MKTKLITALRVCAKALETRAFNYDWTEQHRCNIGILACYLTGLSAKQLEQKLADFFGEDSGEGKTWTAYVGLVCPISGLPEDFILRTLMEVGMSASDISQLENMDDPEVLKRCNFGATTKTVRCGFLGLNSRKETVKRAGEYDDQDDVAIYMRAWADMLVEQGSQDVATEDNTLVCPCGDEKCAA